MDYEQLLIKYQFLLEENFALKSELILLKQKYLPIEYNDSIVPLEPRQLSILNAPTSSGITTDTSMPPTHLPSDIHSQIKLYMSLFKGREDVYAERWENKAGKSGYSPRCLNLWKKGICQKKIIKCAACSKRIYAPLDEKVIESHLRGKIIAGIYPLCADETCHFLAIDFDESTWEKDVAALRSVCNELYIPISIERSRSGNGAHVWIFFETSVSSLLARKLGTALISFTMNQRHEITFKSYDRLFPNQDTLPTGGLGNLIALPFQAIPRKNGNSVFVDEFFLPYPDQWEYLFSIKKLPESSISSLVTRLCVNDELGMLKIDTEENQKPWVNTRPNLTQADFPQQVNIISANGLYIEKQGISQRALNQLKRLAAFKNPEFYKAQAMRMPTFKHPRVIACSDETERYLILPRGCESDLSEELNRLQIQSSWTDEANRGKSIQVEFNGTLRDEQQEAVTKILKFDDGVLAATTAFGKTVIAAKLIAERKVNTLILVHRQQLLTQWITRLSEFLVINEEQPVIEQKNGRKKKQELIGRLCAGKDQLSSIIDVALMQSVNVDGEIKDCVKNYGMIIVDECHHIPATSFGEILKQSNAKYIYGLTATPSRKDGHHPIIFMYCGPVRFRVDALKQAQKRPFEHFVIPRFTGFHVTRDTSEKDLSIQELYSEIVQDELRNQLIVEDVFTCHDEGRHCLVLTERTAHVDILSKMISTRIPSVIALKGGLGSKETNYLLQQLAATPSDKQLTIVATGKFIGEGFDEARLDSLFLAMPISWKGTLQQYAGRLHRLSDHKKEVRVYDYVDVRVRMLEKMYNKRLNGYAAIGYQSKGDGPGDDAIHIIYDKRSFLAVYSQDIIWAKKNILVVSPFITQKRVDQILQLLQKPLARNVEVTIITRPAESFTEKFKTTFEKILADLNKAGVKVVLKSKIHQKFAIIDHKVVWYGSINLLSFGTSEESMMRLVSSNIALELADSIA